MKELQDYLLKFLDESTPIADEEFFQYINEKKVSKSRQDLYQLIRLLLSIVNNYHRYPGFFDKIKHIFNYLKNDIKRIFSNDEIFNICKFSKFVLLYFIKNNFLYLNDSLINDIFERTSKIYFYPEIKQKFEKDALLDKKNESIISDPDFDKKRELGENDSKICSLIRQDLIDEFVIFVNKTNYSIRNIINSSIFETNSFLQDKPLTLIEYAAFFGSFQIFKYLQLNQVELTPSLWIYAIHGKNAEIIHLLEENEVIPKDKSYKKCFIEAVKCHHNDIAEYIQNNYLYNYNIYSNFCHICECHNYAFFPENLNDICFSQFLKDLVNYDFVKIIDIFLINKVIDVNKTKAGEFPLIRYAFNCQSYEVLNLLLSQPIIEISENCFSNCKNLEKITYNESNEFSLITINLKINSSIEKIERLAFGYCNSLTEICLPPTVISIEKCAFSNSSIQKISMLSSQIELKEGWCENTKELKEIYINPDNQNYKIYNNEFIIGKSSIESKNYNVLVFCVRDIKKIVIPDFIQFIQSYAFQFCKCLQYIELSSNLYKIGNNAFEGCEKLHQISIPSLVYSIDNYAFSNCSNLEQINLPASRMYSYDNIFKKYSSISNVSITFSLSNIGEGAFENCTKLKQIMIPSSIKSIKNSVFHNCISLMNITLPSTLTSIGSLSFAGCSSLKTISLPSELISIGSQSFSECSFLEKVLLPSKLEFIGKSAFENCYHLVQINFPPLIKEIEYQTFKNCNKLSRIQIPSNINIYKQKYNFKEMLKNRKKVETIGELNEIDSALIKTELKINVVGNYYVGKTYLIQRYVQNEFRSNNQPTTHFENYFKVVFVNDYQMRIVLRDTSFYCIKDGLIECVFHDSNGFMMVFDLSDRKSLDFVLDWYKSIKEKHGNKYIFVLIGNKCDLNERITYEEPNQIASEYGLPYFEISVIKNEGVNEAFDYILTSILKSKPYFNINLSYPLP